MSKKWLKISNAKSEEATIDIDGDIGESFDWLTWSVNNENTKERIKDKLKQITSNRITVNINSYGGDVNHGLSIHDLLSEHKAEVITNVYGMTASAATIISQAANKGKRRMSSNALMLVHLASLGAYGNKREIEMYLDMLNTVDDKIADIYAKRSGKSKDSFIELMNKANGNGIWLNAEEALEYGLIDEIIEPNKKAVFSNEKMVQFFNKINVPAPPTIVNHNSTDMNLAEEFTKFKNEIGEKLENLKKSFSNDGKTTEVKILDQKEVQDKISEMEAAIKNAVSKEDHDKISNERTQFENDLTEAKNKITQLEAEVAKNSGKPTITDDVDDPDPEKGGKTKSANEKSAEANAAALRSV